MTFSINIHNQDVLGLETSKVDTCKLSYLVIYKKMHYGHQTDELANPWTKPNRPSSE